jgi:hypothetical protein
MNSFSVNGTGGELKSFTLKKDVDYRNNTIKKNGIHVPSKRRNMGMSAALYGTQARSKR